MSSDASAATIVQYSSDFVQDAFAKFNTNLGELRSVVFESSPNKYSFNSIRVPVGASSGDYQVSWNTNGTYVAQIAGTSLSFSLTGSGSQTFNIPYDTTYPSYLYMYNYAAGSASVSLNPDLFKGSFGDTILATGNYLGYNDISDTNYNAPAGWIITRTPWDSEDFAGSSRFKLTYEYDAFNDSAVPEPATWAMMLIGFGFIGWSLRRVKQVATANFA